MPDDGSGGTPYELETHPFTAQRVFAGQVVHRDRAELADSLVGTDEDDAVQVALAAHALRGPGPHVRRGSRPRPRSSSGRRRTWLQRRLLRRVEHGGEFGPGEAGRILVLASLVPDA